jgi:hypothetical protein
VRGTGLAISPGAIERCREARVKLIQKRLQQLLVEARQSRLGLGGFRGLIEVELSTMHREEVE